MIEIKDRMDTVVATVENKEELMKWVGKTAKEMNYGMFRIWYVDGCTYFDCGPRTYHVVGDYFNKD